MKIQLVIPDQKIKELVWTKNHPQSHYDFGVLLDKDTKEITDGFNFRYLRETQNATIKTDDAKKVCGALGVPLSEPGIETVNHD